MQKLLMCLSRAAAFLRTLPPQLSIVRTRSSARALTPLSQISELLELMGRRCHQGEGGGICFTCEFGLRFVEIFLGFAP